MQTQTTPNTSEALATATNALASIGATANAPTRVQSASAALGAGYRLIEVSISQARARVRDSAAERTVADSAGADANERPFSVHKALFPGHSGEELRAASKAFIGIRQYVYSQTLPYSSATGEQRQRGPRLVPNAKIEDLIREIDARTADGNRAVAAFARAYPERIGQARQILGAAFDGSQYPAVELIAGAYGVTVGLSEVPTDSAAPAMLPADIQQRLTAQATAGQEIALRNAITTLQSRAMAAVSKMAIRLADVTTTRLRATVVTDVRDALTALTQNNWTNDPRITQVAEAIERHLLAMDTPQLKANPAAAADVANKAARVAAALKNMDFADVFA